ncbi:MAG TPA: kelch repeat-containing protein, partial [Chitinophagaceae bacterium]|nr:kelch repeat-containing protein [Chitinophagaceae bacterium]
MKKSCLLFLLTLFFLKGYTQPSNTWTQKADFNADPVGWERAYAVGFSINGKGYIGTGSGYLNDFWEYDPVTNVWTQKANVGGMGRREAVGFSMNGKGYVGTGFGYDGSFHFLNDFWEYDPVTNVWTQKANFGGAARTGAVGFSINGKGYIGTGYNGTYFKDFWEYDPTTNLWTRKADFPGTARDEAVGFSINAKGYLGTGGDASFNYNDFWEYDPSANSWNQKAFLPSYSRAGAVGFSINNKGYMGTGYVVGLGA